MILSYYITNIIIYRISSIFNHYLIQKNSFAKTKSFKLKKNHHLKISNKLNKSFYNNMQKSPFYYNHDKLNKKTKITYKKIINNFIID